MACGAKSDVSAMPSGYAAKISPCHVPEMQSPPAVHSVADEPKNAEPEGESKAAKKRREKKEREAAAAAAAAADGNAAGAEAPSAEENGGGGEESIWEKQLEELEALQASGAKLDDSQKNKLKKLKKKAKEKAAKGDKDTPSKKGPKVSAAPLSLAALHCVLNTSGHRTS